MKNYTVLPIYKKDSQNFTNTYIHWYKQYIAFLDNEVWSLIDYLYQFNPNYIVFNQVEGTNKIDETGQLITNISYYSKDDLISLGLLEANEDTKKLFINAPRLLLHTGLINEFNKNYAGGVYLKWGEKTPQEMQEAEIIISNVTKIGINDTSEKAFINDLDNVARQDPNNYFIGRLTANNCYYIVSGVYPYLTFSFINNAEEQYGNIIHLNLYYSRFYYQTQWSTNKGLTIINDFENKEFSLKGDHTVWTGLEQVNHDFTINTGPDPERITGQERIITDDISFQSFISSGIVKIKNPYYSINIQNDQKPFWNEDKKETCLQVDIW